MAQPMDRGVIAKLKAIVRKMYNTWVISLVTGQLGAGKLPSEVKVPADIPTCKTNLFRWPDPNRPRPDPGPHPGPGPDLGHH